MFKFLKKNWQISILIVLLLIMIVPYCYISLNTGEKFYSPDETANYVFTKQFAKKGELFLNEPLNKIADNTVLPRSVNVLDGKLVPGSFLGMPILYGLLAKLFSIKIITYLTPLLSLLGVLLFYFLIKQIFSKNIAFWSALFLLFNPIYWYTAGKAMLHTNLFIFFVILGLLLLFKAIQSKKINILLALSAIIFGFALWVRTSELFWVCLSLLIIYLFNRKKIKRYQVVIFLCFFAFLLSCLLVVNYSVYGSIFSVGYTELEGSTVSNANGHWFIDAWSLIKSVLLPFGFKIKNIWTHFYNFFLVYLWYLVIPAFFGALYFWRHEARNTEHQTKNKNAFAFLLSCFFVFLYLIINYGSFWVWGSSGQPTDPMLSLGNPYLRYWLPIFIFATPFIIIFIKEVLPKLIKRPTVSPPSSHRLPIVFLCLSTVFLIIISTNLVFNDQQDGFFNIKHDVNEFNIRLKKVQSLIPTSNSPVLIIPNWADRIFWPEYSVIHSINDEKIHARDPLPSIAKLYHGTQNTEHETFPIYFYSADSAEDIAELNERFKKHDLQLEKIDEIYKRENLYSLTKTN